MNRHSCNDAGARSRAVSLLLWVAILVGAFTLSTAPAFAQAQGRVIGDPAIILRPDGDGVAVVVRAGTILDVTGQSDRWYEVLIPAAVGGRGERGVIPRSLLELLAGAADVPEKALRGDGVPSQTRPVPPPTQSAEPPRRTVDTLSRGPASPWRFLSMDGAYQATSRVFGESVTKRENAEDGRFDMEYTVSRRPGFTLAGGAMISPRIALGAAVSRFSRATPGALSGASPHPFFFNAPRQVSAQVTGLQREEVAFHLQARTVWGFGSRVELAASGGPSLFRVRQRIVADYTSAGTYPYDTVSFQSAQVVTAKNKALLGLGYNVGGDAAFFFTPRTGLGFTAMFSRATVDLLVSPSRTVQVQTGGTTVGGGLRLRF